jgi:hypothetical protein
MTQLPTEVSKFRCSKLIGSSALVQHYGKSDLDSLVWLPSGGDKLLSLSEPPWSQMDGDIRATSAEPLLEPP